MKEKSPSRLQDCKNFKSPTRAHASTDGIHFGDVVILGLFNLTKLASANTDDRFALHPPLPLLSTALRNTISLNQVRLFADPFLRTDTLDLTFIRRMFPVFRTIVSGYETWSTNMIRTPVPLPSDLLQRRIHTSRKTFVQSAVCRRRLLLLL